ncbi:Wzz/FepE/Etk N-terminal domain-containing protein [Kineococcus gynurae]|uniref:Wzz/FepE/Etk N-terminal domain-containing protein n=1 Tax=Kineococcus gynurae TaxID=452979 RepID=A0ABV5LY32_9ACTN
MELTYYLALLRRRLVLLLLCALVGGAAGYAAIATRAPEYRATTTIYVTMARSESVSALVQGSTYTRNLVQSYVRLATTPTVLDPVIAQLGLDTSAGALAGSIDAEAGLDTAMLDITASAGSADQAAQIANAVGAQVREEALRLAPGTGSSDPSLISVSTVAEATPPGGPSGLSAKLVAIAGMLAGLAAAIGVVVGADLLSTRVRSGVDVAEITDAPVLAGIPVQRPGGGRRQSRGTKAEGLRTLRTHLRLMTGPGSHPLITLALAGPPRRLRGARRDGTSALALGLARALADAETTVLLVEADLRRPTLARTLGLPATPGLADVLAGRAGLEFAVRSSGQADVDVLVAGQCPDDPVELLGTAAARRLFDGLRQRYDVVLLTAPPLGPVADAAVLAAAGDGAVVLTDARSTTRDALAGALSSLHLARARVIGVVLTGLAPGVGATTTWTPALDHLEAVPDLLRPAGPVPTPGPAGPPDPSGNGAAPGRGTRPTGVDGDPGLRAGEVSRVR